MKMKPAGKIAIGVLVVLGLYFGLKSAGINIGGDKTIIQTTATTKDNISVDSEKENSGEKVSSKGFEYTPEKPVNGKLKGVVEVGASGFNSFVVLIDKEKRWELVSKKFGASFALEGMSTKDDIKAGLQDYITDQLNSGVKPNDIQFVVSSGAQKAPTTAGIVAYLKSKRYVVNLVTAEQEGIYAFKATVPPAYQGNSYMMDIGSGNTKISYLNDNDQLTSIEIPGAKYYQSGKTNADVKTEILATISKLPKDKRNVAFVLGGVPFSLAKQTRSGEERFTVLNAPSAYKSGSDKKIESGLNIYDSVKKATNTDTFVFDWDSNFTIGFLLGLK